MIILLDTSSSSCKLSFIDGDWRFDDKWQADRNLANDFLKYLDSKLKEQNKDWSDISGIRVFEGPGSFTGIRIGLTIMNTIADAQNIPIVGGRDEEWQDVVIDKLTNNNNEKIILPFYGSEANITTPRK